MSLINDIIAKLDVNDEQEGILREKLGGLDRQAQETLLEGIRTRSRAKIGPEIEQWLDEKFESDPWTTIVEVAEGVGYDVPKVRGAFSGLVASGKVAIFKNVRRDGARLVFPGGTTEAEAVKMNRQDESHLRPIWRDVLEIVRRDEVEGLPFTADIAEELGLDKSKVMSTCAVLSQYGWLAKHDCKVDGVKVIMTPDAPKEIVMRAAEADETAKRIRKAAKQK